MPPISFLLFCVLLVVIFGLAGLPWFLAFDLQSRQTVGRIIRLPRQPRDWKILGIATAVCVGLGIVWGIYLDFNSDKDFLAGWGRLYMSLLYLLLAGDFFILFFLLVLTFWPKGGAVALAAFREGLRQPMFWMLAGLASVLMLVSPFLPYFTFGEDMKMVKELCYAFTMLSAALFGVVSSSISVNEEIEGRTAVTLMSKPISRRQFLLGKFLGILLSALSMTILVGWVLVWVVLIKQAFDAPTDEGQQLPDPDWLVRWIRMLFEPGSSADLLRGIGLWVADTLDAIPGLILGFCQVMVLTAAAVALATRMPMVGNLTLCLFIYFLGHLTPIMTEVTKTQYALVYFVAQLFETILPGLDLFDVGSAIIRDMPLPPWEYFIYTLNVALYAMTYTAIALLVGLILFEDRDLA